jgi:hypothetical protein
VMEPTINILGPRVFVFCDEARKTKEREKLLTFKIWEYALS